MKISLRNIPNNRTTKKDPFNRGQSIDDKRLCSVWQGLKDSNRTLTDTKNAKWEFT